MVHESFHIPIYNNVLNLVYDSALEITDMLEILEIELEDTFDADGISFEHNNEFWIVFHNNISPGIIAHEAKHYVNSVFNMIRAKLDIDNDENECYLLAYIVDLIFKFVSENKIQLKENKFIQYFPEKKIVETEE